MTFSITIPCLNGMPFLDQTIKSIQHNLKEVDGEIIYQDGGSSDESFESAFEKKHFYYSPLS